MPMLKDYHQFDGRHWETGTIHNVLAYQGVKAPHNGKPISEAMLLGISGGITVGYFHFAYTGYDPHIALLTRNTFDPMETIFERLAIPREVLQTMKTDTAVQNLIDILESGQPAMVWADMFTLPYNDLSHDDQQWAVFPVLVYGYEDGKVFIADRSSQPLIVDAEIFMKARARVKQDKFRVVALHHPDLDKLPIAVQKGIWQCISLFTEAPPKGTRDNFGFAALQKWANMLTNTRNKQSWARMFPPGSALYNALAGDRYQPGLIGWIATWGSGNGAERGVYADFLTEAAQILNKPDLVEVAEAFRKSANIWCDFLNAALPDDVPLLREARELKLRRHQLFVEQGTARFDEIQQHNNRLDEIKATVKREFPMSETEVTQLREHMREYVLKIHDVEKLAVEMLQAALS